MPKNIVVFSDGTGQEGGKKNNTNIYKMFNMLEDRTERQIVFYDRGVGSGWRKITGNIGGMGISRNIKECYEFIFNNYMVGDKIFLFGFSRGAATVRSLSSFIHYFGILPKSRPELIKKAYRVYKGRSIPARIFMNIIKNIFTKFKIYEQADSNYKKEKQKKREELAGKFLKKHHNMWVKIKFLGCYDTVAALGLPIRWISAILDGIPGFRHRFHNFKLSDSVENAYQALAIDDERRIFKPILWDAEHKSHQKISQVWFAGMHTDVGGGYEITDLSDITLVWMTEQAYNQGLLIYPKHEEEIDEKPDGHMHNSREKLFSRLFFIKKQRSWPEERSDIPVVHDSVLKRKKNQNNEDEPVYSPWILDINYKPEPWHPYEKQKWYIKNKP